MAQRWLLYGANGYTGRLIARAAVARGMAPILGGRDAAKLAALSGELGLEQRPFALDAPASILAGLADVAAVLNCAGPFQQTAAPMARACRQAGAHYLDITGEVQVFESLAACDEVARQAGVLHLPGVGFDVVPTDCLAAHLKRRLPSATHLALAIGGVQHVSRGTALTALGGTGYGAGGLIRQAGVLTPVPSAYKARTIDLGEGPMPTRTIPWGDLATAYHSTGIPNIETYLAGSPGPGLLKPVRKLLEPLFGSYVGRRIAQEFVRRRMTGPTDEERARGRSLVWGEVTDAAGRRAVSRLRGSEPYTMTVATALAIMERVLGGEVEAGFQTPAKLYGPDLILSIPGVSRTDEELA